MAMRESSAFRAAALRSEVYRAWVVIGVAMIVATVGLLPHSVRTVDASVRAVALSGLVMLVGLQLLALVIARRAMRLGRDVPMGLIVAGVLVEAMIPTGMIVLDIHFAQMPPYAAMSAPPILAYGVMMCLATLRLRPWLCVLGGGATGRAARWLDLVRADPRLAIRGAGSLGRGGFDLG